MHKTLLISIFLILISFFSAISQTILVTGKVLSVNKDELSYASILINNDFNIVANSKGNFEFKLEKRKNVNIKVTFLGYVSKDTNIYITENKYIELVLMPKNNQIDTIFVIENLYSVRKNETSVYRISVDNLKILPSIAGEKDVIKNLQFLPGITSGLELKTTMNVRGGNNGQNLVLIDNIPIFNINHLGGFLSVFNSDIIHSIEFIKGGFPARFGTKLSSVLNIKLKHKIPEKFQGTFNASNLSLSTSMEVPIWKEKTAVIAGARLFYLDPMLKLSSINLTGDTQYSYYFRDLNLKILYKFNNKSSLSVNYFTTSDFFVQKIPSSSYSPQITNNWGNRIFSLNYNKKLSENQLFDASLSYSDFFLSNSYSSYNFGYYSGVIDSVSEYEKKSASNISQFLFQTNIHKSITSFYEFTFGTNTSIHIFNYKNQDNYKNYELFQQLAFENAFFAENNIEFSKRLSGNIGIRSNLYFSEKSFHSFEPRILISYNVLKDFFVKLSYAKMQQTIHVIPNNSFMNMGDYWQLSNKSVKPGVSNQSSLGLYYDIGQNWFISLESYYKYSQYLMIQKEGASFISLSNNWADKFESGGYSNSYGLELFVQKKQGKMNGWLSYTLSKTMMNFANINSGIDFPFDFDRRHQIDLVFAYNFSNKVIFSANWTYGSPFPYTKALYIYYSPVRFFSPVYEYSARNQFRLDAYHRMDIAINFIKKKETLTRTWQLSIYNAYNKKNAFYYEYEGLNLKKHVLFPFIPSINYRIEF